MVSYPTLKSSDVLSNCPLELGRVQGTHRIILKLYKGNGRMEISDGNQSELLAEFQALQLSLGK